MLVQHEQSKLNHKGTKTQRSMIFQSSLCLCGSPCFFVPSHLRARIFAPVAALVGMMAPLFPIQLRDMIEAGPASQQSAGLVRIGLLAQGGICDSAPLAPYYGELTPWLAGQHAKYDKVALKYQTFYYTLLADALATEQGAVIIRDDRLVLDLFWEYLPSNVPHRLPRDEAGAWSRLAWKMIGILQQYRPDPTFDLFDAYPAGMAIISNLDPTQAPHAFADCRDSAPIISTDHFLDRIRERLGARRRAAHHGAGSPVANALPGPSASTLSTRTLRDPRRRHGDRP